MPHTKRFYKVQSRNSTVLGYPGRGFDWSKFDWDGGAVDVQAPLPWVDSYLIAPNCQYLHVPFDFAKSGTIYRVRPNESMYAGKVYRGLHVERQTAEKLADGWYWVLEGTKEA